jgi:hypothetical protein
MDEKIFSQHLDIDIILTQERLQHIFFRHPELIDNLNLIRKCILFPDLVIQVSREEYKFVNWQKDFRGGKYIIVIVLWKIEKSRAFVVTSYVSRKTPKGNCYE